PPCQGATCPRRASPAGRSRPELRDRHRSENKQLNPRRQPRPSSTRVAQSTRREDRLVAVRRPGLRAQDRQPDAAPRGRPAYSQAHTDPYSKTLLDDVPAWQTISAHETAAPPRCTCATRPAPPSTNPYPATSTATRRSRTRTATRHPRCTPNSPRRSTPTP